MSTVTPTRDQAETTRAVARLTEAIALLNQTAADMLALAATGSDVRGATQIADLARRAADSTDMALIVANNEAKLAQDAPKEPGMTATATQSAAITTAGQLDALPIHARVADREGTEWKKFSGGAWSFRCLGGHHRDGQSSAWLAQRAPLTLIEDPTAP